MIKLVALLLMPASLASGVLVAVESNADERADQQRIEWGGRSFGDAVGLAAWLAARGVAYATWAERHPAAAARLEGREPAVQPSSAAGKVADERHGPRPHQPDAQSGAPRQPAGDAVSAQPRETTSLGVLAIAVGLAGGALVVASAASPALRRWHVGVVLSTHRGQVGAAGVSLLAGVAIGIAL